MASPGCPLRGETTSCLFQLTFDHAPVATGLSGACTDAGAIGYDAAVGALVFCDGTEWRRVSHASNIPGTALTSGAIRWADGSMASTCDGYRNPTDGLHVWDDAGTGLYDIDPTGTSTALRVLCDMDHDAFGWTVLVGTGAQDTCAFWSVTGNGTKTCSATQVSATTISDDGGEFTLRVTPSWSFRHLRYTGTVFSSGGTNGPVWDEPDSADRHGAYTGRTCGENTSYTRETDLGATGADAWWYAWSDYGNVCGGSGASWTLTWVAIR